MRHKAVFSRFTQITVWMLQLTVYPHIKFIPQSLGISSDSLQGLSTTALLLHTHLLVLTGLRSPLLLTPKWPFEALPLALFMPKLCLPRVQDNDICLARGCCCSCCCCFCHLETFEQKSILVFTCPFIPTPST